MPVTKDEVIWGYRIFLGRAPESEEVVKNHMRTLNIFSLCESFINSSEFINKQNGQTLPKSLLPTGNRKNEIEYKATESQLVACHTKIKAAWSYLGMTKPHFSVITQKQFLPEEINKNIDSFWASGEEEVVKIQNILASYGFTSLSTKTCLEYGCGVGRVSMGLARRFSQVHCYDISQEHLSLLKQRALEIGLSNCRYFLCSDDFYNPLEPCDFYYSNIVFQHNPPPIIHHLITQALRSLNPDGIAIFQVPTYKTGYSFSLKDWIAADHTLTMQMHVLPQEVIFNIIANERCVPLEIRADDSAGSQFLSNTFVVRKQS